MSQTDPSSVSSRLLGLDLARFLAFVGMVIVNFKVVMGAEESEGALAFFTGMLEGRAAATFVVLAGVGLGLSALKGTRDTLWVTLRRAAFLLVIGLLNMLIFEADILHYYAFFFLVGVVLLPLSSGALAGAIIALNVLYLVLMQVLNYEAGWNWTDYSYSGFWTMDGFIRNLFFNGWHPVIPWSSFLLFGIILSRLQLTSQRTQIKLIIGGVLAYALAEFISAGLLSMVDPADTEFRDILTTSAIPPMPLYILAGLGAASTVTGLCLMFADQLNKIGVLRFLVPAGRQTLTLYIAHILIGMGALEELGMLGGQSLETAVIASLVFCAFAVVYAVLWSKRFKRGPVEALMRKVAG